MAYSAGSPADITTLSKSSVWPNLYFPSYVKAPMLIDLARSANPWSGDGNKKFEDFLIEGSATRDGAIVSAPAGVTELTSVFWGGSGDAEMSYLSGRYTLRWTGANALTINGDVSNEDHSVANQISFDMDATGTKNTRVEIDVAGLSYPLNPQFTVIKDSLKTSYDGGEIFDPTFLSVADDFGGFRSMDMGAINANRINDWADRPLLTDQFWGAEDYDAAGVRYTKREGLSYQRGLPWEVIFGLAVKLGVKVWVNIPARVTDAYISALATMIRDDDYLQYIGLIELGNEFWNDSFSNTDYAIGKAWENWGPAGWDLADYDLDADEDPYDPNVTDGLPTTSGIDWQGMRTVQMATLMRAVLGDTDQLKFVFGAWTNGSSQAPNFLDSPLWLSKGTPAGYVAPYTIAGSLSITTYFGNAVLKDNADAIMTQLAISEAAGITYIEGLVDADVPVTKGEIANYASLCSTYGIALHMYEGNEHLNLEQANQTSLYVSGTSDPEAGVLEMIHAYADGQHVSDAKDELRDYFKSVGGQIQCPFSMMNPWSKFGQWGYKQFPSDVTPSYTDLVAWQAANPRDFLF